MSGSHKTSAIPRLQQTIAAHPSRPRRDRSLLDDFTRPIEAEHRLVTSRSNRWIIGLLGVAVLGALMAALFVLPVQAWMRQQDEIDTKQQELSVLTDANNELSGDVQHLQTVEGAREAARDELGVIDRGEERVSVLPSAAGPLPLPAGWPYDAINQIVAVRSAPPVTAPPVTAPAATVAPTTPPAAVAATVSGATAPAATVAQTAPAATVPQATAAPATTPSATIAVGTMPPALPADQSPVNAAPTPTTIP